MALRPSPGVETSCTALGSLRVGHGGVVLGAREAATPDKKGSNYIGGYSKRKEKNYDGDEKKKR